MDRKIGWGLGLAVAGMLAGAVESRAQQVPAGAAGVAARGAYANPIPAGQAYGAAYANPYTSPAFLPYMNPAMAIDPKQAPDAALWYLLQQQRASGGIGSGRLSGVAQAEEGRPAPDPAAPQRPLTQRSTPAAFMPRSAATPYGAADRYFMRAQPSRTTAGRYYNRAGGRFNR